jgi:hypothetical protein
MTFVSNFSLNVVYCLEVVEVLKATYFVLEGGISFGLLSLRTVLQETRLPDEILPKAML